MVTAKVLDTGADAALQQALGYWQRVRGQRPMPARKDLNPADIPRLLPKLMLADVGGQATDTQAPQISFRLVGTEVIARFGCELTGCRLSEIDYGAQTDEVADLYRRAVDRGEPQYACIEFRQSRVRLFQMQHLLLPLSDDGAKVNMILAVVHCQ
ncbi:MAG: PAS domain-containing protein [Alphaproteobacteria bacterium]|nr:PAS domain-containing protein [Alphaproteobacteria bacterium]